MYRCIFLLSPNRVARGGCPPPAHTTGRTAPYPAVPTSIFSRPATSEWLIRTSFAITLNFTRTTSAMPSHSLPSARGSDFVVTCQLIRPSCLVCSSCPSGQRFATGFVASPAGRCFPARSLARLRLGLDPASWRRPLVPHSAQRDAGCLSLQPSSRYVVRGTYSLSNNRVHPISRAPCQANALRIRHGFQPSPASALLCLDFSTHLAL